MIARLLPALIALVGLGGGVGAGIALRSDPAPAAAETAAAPCGIPAEDADAQSNPEGDAAPAARPAPAAGGHAAGRRPLATEFVKIDNQFIVPVIEYDRVAAMVILSVTLEVAEGQADGTYARLPKLRDRFLRAMLDHANVGGFSGTFTADGSVEQLRRNLMEVGRKELGDVLSDVLILDLNRQSV